MSLEPEICITYSVFVNALERLGATKAAAEDKTIEIDGLSETAWFRVINGVYIEASVPNLPDDELCPALGCGEIAAQLRIGPGEFFVAVFSCMNCD